LKRIVVDTSAIIAILNSEPESRDFASICLESPDVLISAASVHEASSVVVRRRMESGAERLAALMVALELNVVGFGMEQLTAARAAYTRYGRGTGHKAYLNMGDCFSYALAKSRNLPLLFKGDDFIHTDIEPALRPA